jgi:hypothetical protein
LNWAEVTTTLSDQAVLTEVLIVSPTLIYAGYSDPTMQFGLLKSEDGGVTWNFDINSATFFYPIFWSLAQANDGTIYSGGEYPDGNTGLIFSTEDGINFNYDVVDQPIYSMESIHEDMTWGVGDSGYVVVNVPLAQLGVSETTMEVEMIEIYPNPTSGMIKITGNEIDHIELIDLQMKKVDIEFVPDNSGGFETDLSNLPSGVYFVRSKIGETIKSSKIIKL